VFDRSLGSGGKFCVSKFGVNLDSVAVKMFSYLNWLKKITNFTLKMLH
jgi:hypothetical protein